MAPLQVEAWEVNHVVTQDPHTLVKEADADEFVNFKQPVIHDPSSKSKDLGFTTDRSQGNQELQP